MAGEKGLYPARDGGALMFLRQIGDGTCHPIITDIRGPQIQMPPCNRAEFRMALHAENMVIDVIHGVRTIACAAKMGGPFGKRGDLILMKMDQLHRFPVRHPARVLASVTSQVPTPKPSGHLMHLPPSASAIT